MSIIQWNGFIQAQTDQDLGLKVSVNNVIFSNIYFGRFKVFEVDHKCRDLVISILKNLNIIEVSHYTNISLYL